MRLPLKGGEYERMKKLNKGFTLIELLVVIAVLGILAAVVLVAINPTARIQDARNSGVRSDIGQLGTAMEAYFTENNGNYPTSALSELVSDDQLKQLPSPPSGRDTSNCVSSYVYVTGSTEAAAYSDLEPCGGSETYYVYWTACGQATESDAVPDDAGGAYDVDNPTSAC